MHRLLGFILVIFGPTLSAWGQNQATQYHEFAINLALPGLTDDLESLLLADPVDGFRPELVRSSLRSEQSGSKTLIQGSVFFETATAAERIFVTIDLNGNNRADHDEPRLASAAAGETVQIQTQKRTAYFHTVTNCSCLGKDNCIDTYDYRITMIDFESGEALSPTESHKYNMGPDCGFTFNLGRQQDLNDQVLNYPIDRLGIK